MSYVQLDDIIDQSISRQEMMDFRSAMTTIRARLGRQLSACHMDLEHTSEVDQHLIFAEIARIQCALDIISSTKTSEGLNQIYRVLKQFQTY